MHRYFAMHRHWRRCGPPTYLAVALYLGLTKPERTTRSTIDDPDDLAKLLDVIPGGARA